MQEIWDFLKEPSDPVEEAIFELMVPDELGEPTTIWEALEEREWTPPHPRLVSSDDVSGVLHGLVCDLAWMHVYLHCVDHLSDMELYEELYELIVDYPKSIWPDDPDSAISLHFALGEDDEGETWLRYYACESDRKRWAQTYPERTIPPAELPMYRRDWLPIRPD